jgi:hypothetical protein
MSRPFHLLRVRAGGATSLPTLSSLSRTALETCMSERQRREQVSARLDPEVIAVVEEVATAPAG